MPSHKSLHDTSQGNDPEIAAQIQAKKQLLNDMRERINRLKLENEQLRQQHSQM